MRLTLIPIVALGLVVGGPVAARAQEAAPPAAAAMAPANAQVARAVFARAIAQREPQEVVSSIDADAQQIYFFTELLGMEGRTVRHRWELDGQVMAEVTFQVGAPRWRVHSSKRLIPGQPGAWTVFVVDESGSVLRTETLGRALATPEPSSPTPPASPAQ